MNTALTNAKWIWHNDYKIQNVYLNFFDKLNAKSGKKYTMYISADSNYALYINGTFVESGQFADYPEYKIYDTLDITPFVKEGENEIKIVGFWHGRDWATYRHEPAGMLYAVEEDGAVVLVSDESTTVCHNSCFKNEGVGFVSPQVGFTFDCDLTKEDEKNALKNADIQDKPATLYPRAIKKLDIGSPKASKIVAWGEIKDVSGDYLCPGDKMHHAYMAYRRTVEKVSLPSEEGYTYQTRLDDSEGLYFIIDLGAESVGYINLDLDLPQDTKMTVAFGEHLDDMRVRSYIDTREFTAVITAKKGRNTFFNPLRRLGMRYLQLNIYTKSIKIHYAGIRPTVYPVSDVPYFKCSDHLHNKIYDICIDTLKHCMHEHYEDCPWREQALYAMDSRNQMLCGYYTFGEYEFARESLRLIARSIKDNNFIDLIAPGRFCFSIPSFCAVFVTQIYEYVQHSGDLNFIDEMKPYLERIVGEFVSRIDEKGILEKPQNTQPTEFWNFYEWQEGLDGHAFDKLHRVYDAPLNAFVSMALRSYAYILGFAGDEAGKNKYMQMHNDLNTAIDKFYWDEKENAYYSFVNAETGDRYHFSQLNQALIVYCGACPEEKLDTVLDKIAHADFHEATLSHKIFVYEALMKRPDTYAKFVMNEIADIWGYMLYHNATTFWEDIGGADSFLEAGSLCHGWSATPTYIYFKYGAGIKAREGEIATYDIKPENCGLYECQAYITTPKGEITVK